MKEKLYNILIYICIPIFTIIIGFLYFYLCYKCAAWIILKLNAGYWLAALIRITSFVIFILLPPIIFFLPQIIRYIFTVFIQYITGIESKFLSSKERFTIRQKRKKYKRWLKTCFGLKKSKSSAKQGD